MATPLLSRGPLGYAASVFAGGLSVVLLIVSIQHMNTPLLYLAYLTALPLYLAGLGGGAVAGIIATVTGTAALYATQQPNIAIVYTIAVAVPALAIIALLLRYRMDPNQQVHWYPEGFLLTIITLYPCFVFLSAVVMAWDHSGGLLALTIESFHSLSKQIGAKFGEDHIDQIQAMMAIVAKIMPAMGAYVWIFVTMICIAGAQYILRNQKLNLRDRLSINEVHLPSWIIYAVAITGLFGVYGSEPYDYIGRNLSLILGLPFLFVGIAVVQVFASSIRFKVALLIVFYLLLVAVPWTSLFVAGLGIIDQWADFRLRITRKTTV